MRTGHRQTEAPSLRHIHRIEESEPDTYGHPFVLGFVVLELVVDVRLSKG